jgi:hypothetical protein
MTLVSHKASMTLDLVRVALFACCGPLWPPATGGEFHQRLMTAKSLITKPIKAVDVLDASFNKAALSGTQEAAAR